MREGGKRFKRITLEYRGKRYTFDEDFSKYDFPGANEANPFMWEEGNFSCDCNKSLFIRRECDPQFPEMTCGEKIKLIDQQFIGDWVEPA